MTSASYLPQCYAPWVIRVGYGPLQYYVYSKHVLRTYVCTCMRARVHTHTHTTVKRKLTHKNKLIKTRGRLLGQHVAFAWIKTLEASNLRGKCLEIDIEAPQQTCYTSAVVDMSTQHQSTVMEGQLALVLQCEVSDYWPDKQEVCLVRSSSEHQCTHCRCMGIRSRVFKWIAVKWIRSS